MSLRTRADRERPPDVVLIVLDTLRVDRLSCYGYPRSTSPHIDAFAQDAILFERAISPAQWTIPAHASLFTGQYPGRLPGSGALDIGVIAHIGVTRADVGAGVGATERVGHRQTGRTRKDVHFDDLAGTIRRERLVHGVGHHVVAFDTGRAVVIERVEVDADAGLGGLIRPMVSSSHHSVIDNAAATQVSEADAVHAVNDLTVLDEAPFRVL